MKTQERKMAILTGSGLVSDAASLTFSPDEAPRSFS